MAKEVLELTVKSNIGEVTKGTKELTNEASNAVGEFRFMGVSLNGVKKAFASAAVTAKGMFGTIKAGLISTGIGAFVVLIGSLMVFLTKTKKGAELLQTAFAGVGAAIAVITDRISAIGGAIAKVFSGDFKGAITDVKGALTGIGDEMSREIRLAKELERTFQRIADSERGLNLERAEANKIIAKARLDAEDETKTLEERMVALQKANDEELKITAKSLALQKEKVEATRQEVGMGESMSEDLEKLNQEKIKLINMETASFSIQKRLTTGLETLKVEAATKQKAREKERQDGIKAEAKAVKDLEEKLAKDKKQLLEDFAKTQKTAEENELQAIKDKYKDVLAVEVEGSESKKQLLENEQAELKVITDKYEAKKRVKTEEELKLLVELQNENTLNLIDDLQKRALAELKIQEEKELASIKGMENFEAMKVEIDKKYSKLRGDIGKEADQKEKDRKKALLAFNLGMADQGLGIIADAAGEGTALAKAAAIAQATISGVQGVQNAFTSANANIPATASSFGAYPVTMAALAGVFAAANIAKIASGTPASPSDAPPPPSTTTPAPQMMSGAFQLGGGVKPEPMKAFVVTDEMSNSQSQLANIRRRATI